MTLQQLTRSLANVAIRFVKDYRVAGSSPPEVYTNGQLVSDMTEASEFHFIVRGAAVPVKQTRKTKK